MCIARRVIFDEYPPIIIDSNDILEGKYQWLWSIVK